MVLARLRSPLGIVVVLLGAAFVTWIVDRPAHARHGRRPGHGPRRPGLVRRDLGDDDGGDDAAVGRADGAAVRPRVARSSHGAASRSCPTWLFVAGYLAVWTACGLVAYGIYRPSSPLDPGLLAWDRAGPYVAGGALAAAGLYQLTPLKDVCLRHCRSPLHFLLHGWRAGGSARCGWAPSTAPTASAAAGG